MSGVFLRRRTTRDGQVRWMVVYRVGGRYGRERSAGTFPTQKLARARAELVWAEIAAGRDPAHAIRALERATQAPTGYAELHERWVAGRVDLKQKSRTLYRQHGNALAKAVGGRDPHTLTPADVQEIVAHLTSQGLAPSTVADYMGTFRQVLDSLGIDPNPARHTSVRLPRVERRVVSPPTRTHVHAMRRHLDGDWLLAFDLLEATGLRVGELQHATYADLDTHDSRLRVAVDGKTTSSRRWATLPGHVLARLLDRVAPEDRLPERRLLPSLTDHGMRKRMARACRDAGIPLYSPHDLRHRWISLALRRGVPLAEVAAAAGHARQSMTADRYSHVVIEAGDYEPVAWSHGPGADTNGPSA